MIVSYIEKHYSDDVDTTEDIVVRGGHDGKHCQKVKKTGRIAEIVYYIITILGNSHP